MSGSDDLNTSAMSALTIGTLDKTDPPLTVFHMDTPQICGHHTKTLLGANDEYKRKSTMIQICVVVDTHCLEDDFEFNWISESNTKVEITQKEPDIFQNMTAKVDFVRDDNDQPVFKKRDEMFRSMAENQIDCKEKTAGVIVGTIEFNRPMERDSLEMEILTAHNNRNTKVSNVIVCSANVEQQKKTGKKKMNGGE